MDRNNYKKCNNCEYFRVRGDDGECHNIRPQMPELGMKSVWPPVSPNDYCSGFVLNPTSLFDEIDSLRQLAKVVTVTDTDMKQVELGPDYII
jgi:hypothetical protein